MDARSSNRPRRNDQKMDARSSNQSWQNDREMDEIHIEPTMDSESASVGMLSGRVRSHEPSPFWKIVSPGRTPSGKARSDDSPSSQKRRSTGSGKDEIQRNRRSNGERDEQIMGSPSMQNRRPRLEELEQNSAKCTGWRSVRLCGKIRRSLLYGKIWRSVLYGKIKASSNENDKEHPLSNALCSLLLISLLLGVITTVSYFQLKSWQQVTRSYYTDNPHDSTRGGLPYTCGCSLPSIVESVQSVQNQSEQTNLNICHAPSDQETVTILMFSNSTAEKAIHEIIDENSMSDSTRPINRTHDGGFHVTQDAHELTVENNTVYDYLKSLYIGGTIQPAIFPTVEYLLSPNFNDFPRAYVQLSWIYDCDDCDNCSQAKVMDLSRKVLPTNESWISCYGYGPYAYGKPGISCYTDKCVVYPPKALPASLVVKSFLDEFVDLPGIESIRTSEPPINLTKLLPSVLYLNISHATNSSIQLGFLEVQRGSALWASLSSNFPSVDNNCTDLSPVRICNGTSICNAFTNANSYDLQCLDFTNHSQCEPFQGSVTPDNIDGIGYNFSDIICPESLHCVSTPPYLVTRNISEAGEKDALNHFLASNKLDNEWKQSAGVCTKTYLNVIRHRPASRAGTPSHNPLDTMFLDSDCSTATVNQPAFCWVTGRFRYLSDFPEGASAQLPDDLFQPNSSRFACYRLERQGFLPWFITTFGVLFGWIGTVQLVFYATFFWIFVPARNRLCGRSRYEESGSPPSEVVGASAGPPDS